MARTLSGPEVERLLRELVTELATLGETASVYVIGGAALALHNPLRQSTNDIDGFIHEPIDATQVLERLRARWGLEGDWFNSHAKCLLPPVSSLTEMFAPVSTIGEVTLFIARTEALLAMKLRAARAKDQNDIAYLLRECAVTSVDEADDVFERYFPGDSLSAVARARVDAALSV